jgi:hypothetical protein
MVIDDAEPYDVLEQYIDNTLRLTTSFYRRVPTTMAFAEALPLKSLTNNHIHVFIADQQT